MLQVANAATSLVEPLDGRRRWRPARPTRTSSSSGTPRRTRAELREFVKAVRGEPSTSPTFEDGRAALILADAAQRSALERTSVRVDLE